LEIACAGTRLCFNAGIMSFNENKYRIRFSYPGVFRGERKGFNRLAAIRELANPKEGVVIDGKVDFHQRKMIPGHLAALKEAATAWRRLDEYEKAVRERKGHRSE
jgi:hypothetical protein